MEEVNDPVYFHQFVEHALRHGLQYLVEVDLRTVLPLAFKPETQAALQKMVVGTIDLEQQMDFLRNRMFRQTLLCHAEVPVQRTILPQPVMSSWLRSQATRTDVTDATQRAGVVQFISKDEATISTDHPLTVAALGILAQAWPRALSFAELVKAARQVLEESEGYTAIGAPEEMTLAANLLRAYGRSPQLVDLHCFHPPLVTTMSERPLASATARFEAQTRTTVTNMWHERVTLLPIQQEILPFLDGEHTLEELVALLDSTVSAAELNEHLRWFAFAALLVG